jgi:DNA-directed RNA polymerase subunit RPC12/RpoP
VAEFYEEYPERAQLPLAGSDGVRLRREFVEEEYEEWAAASEQPFEAVAKGEQRTAVEAVTWGEAVERALTRYEETRQTTVNLERGRPSDFDYAEHSVQAQTRWFADYQKSYFAQLKAWMRELTGGERPSGGSTEGIYENPYIVLITRSASSVPEGERLPPVEHARAIQESWEPVYHTLRNTVRSLGFESGEWQYERRAEAHTGERGGGVNHCFGHGHTVMVVDGEIEESDLAPVVEKHVEECGPAGPDAHEVGEAIEVFQPEEVEDVAAYVASYTGIKPSGLLERETEYVAWAAAMDAGNIRTKSRSDAARQAASADKCKQRFESDQADQERGHGEKVVRAVSTARHEYECAECGSPHEIAQDTTLTAHRTESGETAVADGGRDFEAERRNALRGQWEDARGAASVGETPTRLERREKIEAEVLRRPSASAAEILGRLGLPASCGEFVEEVRAGVDRSEVVGFERAPSWHVKSVTVGEEEYPASAGNGVEMVATDGGETWRPPHDGGRACPSCGSDSVVSAREAESVYHEEVGGAYWCSTCDTEFGPVDAPEEPPPMRR